MRKEEHYRWRCQTVTGRWYTTNFSCSEEFIRRGHPEAMRVEHTRVVRQICESDEEVHQRTHEDRFPGGPAPA